MFLRNNAAQCPAGKQKNCPIEVESGALKKVIYFCRVLETKLMQASQVCFSHSPAQKGRPQLTHPV